MNSYPRRGPAGPPPEAQTMPIPRVGPPLGSSRTDTTQPIPAVVPEPGLNQAAELAEEQTRVLRPVSEGKSLGRSVGSMAVATLISRITGFLWKVMLAWAIGLQVNADAFTVANNLPNSVFELLIGGVLTSVIVPVLVRAGKEDADGGEAYIQRLLSLSLVLLIVGTVLAVLASPLLVGLFMQDQGNANPELAAALAYYLLPQIFFYGLSALVSAILQAKRVFSPPAWAPVVNNLVVIVVLSVLIAQPGTPTFNPVRMTDPALMTLGIGVTLGVVGQALIQLPALRKTGIRFRWRWGWDARLTEFGGLALWMISYVAISMIGLMVMSQVGTRSAVWTQYNFVWMLIQLPYGVLGFSVMTAILPRMSAAAADGDYERLKDDLSLGNRLSTVSLLPISAVMAVTGVPLCLALLSMGESVGNADQVGMALAVSAFGVLPYAITMMQMRVFYALKDARTPTMIMVVMTVFKAGFSLLCLLIPEPELVLYALAVINSFSFVVGWLFGELLLRRRLGPLGSGRLLRTLGKTALASVVGAGLTWLVTIGIGMVIPGPVGVVTGWAQLVTGTVIGFAAIFGLMIALRVNELRPAIGRLEGLLRRR